MRKDKQKEFARRIAQANRTELLVVTYDIILEEIHGALEAFVEQDMTEYRHSLKQAQRFLSELMSTLDFRYEPAVRLMSIYEYVQRILVRSDARGDDAGLAHAIHIISRLREAYNQIADQDTRGTVMQNAQTVFAGLTYGRGSLNETNIDPNGASRGFLA